MRTQHAEPWPTVPDADDPHGYRTAQKIRRVATVMWHGDESHVRGDCKKSRDARICCGTCALHGYEPRGGWGDGFSVRRDGPNYAGWQRIYVEAGIPIPAKWRQAFENARHDLKYLSYASALERSIATFGVIYEEPRTPSPPKR